MDTNKDLDLEEYSRYLGELSYRQQRIKDGFINCIRLPFKRLRRWLPGIEKRRYTIITANQKIGKSKLADYMYIYYPFFYGMEHPGQFKLSVLYFTLEMGKKEKFYEFLCYLLYRLDNIRIDPTNLKSTNADNPCPDYILEKLNSEEYKRYIREYKKTVTYIEDIKNPTGIYKEIKSFMAERGTQRYKKVMVKDENGLPCQVDKFDYFEYKNKDEYVVVILDNYSNLSLESGYDKRSNIEKMSKYAISLRDRFDIHFCAVQHQAQSQEGIENQKLNKLYPTSDGLADCKTTTRDANLVLGLFSPFKYGLTSYEGYDITKFKNNIRFLMVLEDRDNGAGGQVCPLLFDGEVSSFTELPLPNDKNKIADVIRYIEEVIRERSSASFMMVNKINLVRNLHRWPKWFTFATIKK